MNIIKKLFTYNNVANLENKTSAFAGTFAFLPLHSPTKKSKRACKPTH
jgi:hypothetical protein